MSGLFVLTAGGTGGHIFPAEALAAELARRGRRLALITDRRAAGYERRFAGVDLHVVPAGSFAGKNSVGKIQALAEIGMGVVAARALLKRLQPAAVIGFGGYPSLPAMLAASSLRLPTLLHEQNALLGRVNRFLAGRVATIATSFAATASVPPTAEPKLRVTGNPVRPAVAAIRDVPYTSPNGDGSIRLLVMGGSQGATVLSDVVPEALRSFPPELRARLRVTQQCRQEDLERVREVYREAGIAADLASFFDDVPAQLAACHIAVTRSGASTVSELCVAGRPAILVPYPHAADDHQTFNAKAIALGGGAALMPQPRFTPSALKETLAALFADSATLSRMARAAREAGRPRAAEALADLVEELAPGNGHGQDAARKEAA